MESPLYRQAVFQIDSIPNVVFQGFTDGSDWNGFAAPLFDFGTAQDVLARSEPNGFAWRFDPEIDAFVVADESDPDDEDVFAGETIDCGGVEAHVYPIGARSWIWSEVED